jgi:hypothetical protein
VNCLNPSPNYELFLYVLWMSAGNFRNLVKLCQLPFPCNAPVERKRFTARITTRSQKDDHQAGVRLDQLGQPRDGAERMDKPMCPALVSLGPLPVEAPGTGGSGLPGGGMPWTGGVCDPFGLTIGGLWSLGRSFGDLLNGLRPRPRRKPRPQRGPLPSWLNPWPNGLPVGRNYQNCKSAHDACVDRTGGSRWPGAPESADCLSCYLKCKRLGLGVLRTPECAFWDWPTFR